MKIRIIPSFFTQTILLVSLLLISPLMYSQNGSYKVQAGETAYSIAKANKVSLKTLYGLNPGIEQNGIRTGMTLIMPQKTAKNEKSDSYIFHTIAKNETLYSVSKKYSIPVSDILDANESLTTENFQEGREIRIPKLKVQRQKPTLTYTLYHVQPGETIYSLARANNVSVEEIYTANPELKTSGLKKNALVRIPKLADRKKSEVEVSMQDAKGDRLLSERTNVKYVHTVKIGMLFPFVDSGDGQSSRLVEYLQGFLLAVKDFKQKGYSADVYVFNIDAGSGTTRLQSLLETDEFKYLNVLIGGVSPEQIDVLANFAKQYKVNYVIPFSSKRDDILNNEYVYQVNTAQDFLYAPIAKVFAQNFANSKVIFVDNDGDADNNDKAEFVHTLKSELQKNGIQYESLELTGDAGGLISMLNSDKNNVIVPTSGSYAALSKVIASVKTAMQSNSSLQCTLFGYPEWQTYNSSVQSSLHQLNASFYSPFYTDVNQWNYRQFSSRFTQSYGKDLMNLYPKYGLLGYDAGTYFLNAVKLYGANFGNSVEKIKANTIQSAIDFSRVSNWGGFANNGYYIVHYGTSSIDKTEYK